MSRGGGPNVFHGDSNIKPQQSGVVYPSSVVFKFGPGVLDLSPFLSDSALDLLIRDSGIGHPKIESLFKSACIQVRHLGPGCQTTHSHCSYF